MNENSVFQRVENKYLITAEQAQQIQMKAEGYLRPDRYAKYTIHSIYYDTADSAMVISCLEKPEYKEKLRLRCYGQPHEGSRVFLEIKKKYRDLGSKRRITLDIQEAEDYMEHGIPHSVHSQIADEIDYMKNMYSLQKKLYLAYDRMAFAGISEEDLRITFDYSIRYRTDNLSLYELGNESLMSTQDTVLMEIKAMKRYPLWLCDILTSMHIYKNSFSKYGAIYSALQKQETKGIYIPDMAVQYARPYAEITEGGKLHA